MFRAESSRSARPGFVDRAVLEHDKRLARFSAVDDYSFVVDAAIQVGLQVSSHGAMHGTWQQSKNHAVGMMDPAPRQFEAAAESDFLEGSFDRLDHLGHRENLRSEERRVGKECRSRGSPGS